MNENLLEVRNLKTYFYTYDGIVRALDGVSFEIRNEKILGLVGETGCGKSVTALSIMRLIYPPGRVSGEVMFKGEDLLRKPEAEMRKIRGCDISMIFQEPMTALNPVFSIGKQIMDLISLHQKVNKKDAMEKALEILSLVGLPDVEKKLSAYPHELSGGMQQRIMISMALSCHPALLIADEPTTSLDVTIEAQILRLIKKLKNELKMAVLFITHDLGVVAETCDDVAVMYAGHIVECAPVKEFFKDPKHPYTCGLLKSNPRYYTKEKKLPVIEGSVADVINPPKGCIFRPRCQFTTDVCRRKKPELKREGNHLLACHNK